MKCLVFALSCAVAVGCNDASKPAGTGAPSRTDVRAEKPVTETNKPTDRDNTRENIRDRDHATKTPIDQNENKKDVNLTADIRKRVVDAKMSTNAHNVKIITQDGKVTLRGPVNSAEEKQQIEQIAEDIAGAGNVDSEIEVKTNE